MTKYKHLHKNYTTNRSTFQLKIPIELEFSVPDNDSVRLVSQVIEEMDLKSLYDTYQRINRRGPTPTQMLKIIIYASMNRLYSARDIEKACKRDTHFMYLLEDSLPPDHSTIARFRTLHLNPCIKVIMKEMTCFLAEHGELSKKTIYIDGTKIEANANRYTFVWIKSVTKHNKKLQEKIVDFVAECEAAYGIRIIYENQVTARHVRKLAKQLHKIKEAEGIEFVHGKGSHKTQLQRDIEQINQYLNKLKEYARKQQIAGKRNSYSKTDTDATFMRLKDDHMRNGQLKAAYNAQYGVDAEYMVWVTLEQKANDVNTLIPFLKDAKKHLKFTYQNIVCDAGYESEENYVTLEKNKQIAYIKPQNYERSKTSKYKKDIGRHENMDYDPEADRYTCKNGKKLRAIDTKITKSATEYESEKTIYLCEDCSDCPYKKDCIKGNNSKTPLEERTKRFEISKLFLAKRHESLKRITSEKGNVFRINRSIQAEGTIGNTKSNMRFHRFQTRGKDNVLTELVILALGHNINKLHSKIQNGHTRQHLLPYKEQDKIV